MNQGELSAHCSFIGMNDAYFNSHYLPNTKHLFSETVSPKNPCQVSFDKKGDQNEVLVSFTATPLNINTDIYTVEQISSPLSRNSKTFDTKLRSLFGVTYRKIRGIIIIRRALKARYDCSFWLSEKLHK